MDVGDAVASRGRASEWQRCGWGLPAAAPPTQRPRIGLLTCGGGGGIDRQRIVRV